MVVTNLRLQNLKKNSVSEEIDEIFMYFNGANICKQMKYTVLNIEVKYKIHSTHLLLSEKWLDCRNVRKIKRKTRV